MRALWTTLLAAFVLLLSASLAVGQDIEWRRYVNDDFGYRIDLPLGLFEITESKDAGLSLTEVDGLGQIEIYGAYNELGLSTADFADELSQADRIDEVTYRTGGRSWFVLSGYYAREGQEVEDLIFYAKFMFSADRSRVAAFEISYPLADKRRFDRIVARLERSLRAPR